LQQNDKANFAEFLDVYAKMHKIHKKHIKYIHIKGIISVVVKSSIVLSRHTPDRAF